MNLQNIEHAKDKTDQSETNKIMTHFEEIFKTIRPMKDNKIRTQMNSGHAPLKQKVRPKPYKFQKYIEKNSNEIFDFGQLKEMKNVEDCFVFPVIETLNEKYQWKMTSR